MIKLVLLYHDYTVYLRKMEELSMTKIRLAVATADDAARLLEIYRPYVLTTAITFEYEVPTLEEFRARIVST